MEEDGILSSLSKNAECCVLLLRELEKIGEISHHAWCKQMKELIVETNEKRKEWMENERECFEEPISKPFLNAMHRSYIKR